MINPTLQALILNFSNENLNRFMRNRSGHYSPRKQQLAEYNDDTIKDGWQLGSIRYSDVEELVVCSFKVAHALSERSGKKMQYEKAKKILKEQMSDAGIFVFHDETGCFRFSLVYADYAGKKRNWSTFKRFTYFVDPKASNKTFSIRVGEADFSSIDKLRDAFSVEKVTKEFYQELSYWYFWAVQNSVFPKDAEAQKNGRNMAVIRLITRMIFIWFMREKKLIQRELFEEYYINMLLNDLSEDESTYYLAILQNLFFATLNTPQEDRRFRGEEKGPRGQNKDYGNQYVYRYHKLFRNAESGMQIFKDIPFLNGGLFECLDNKDDDKIIDGFTDIQKNRPVVPNYLFFGDERAVDINTELGTSNKRYIVKGLINLLSAFNFTIDENTLDDQEVALDPELLGRVFENLLASFNPETSTTARKATGSYYTPREIVDYMVTESLVAYFESILREKGDTIQKGTAQYIETQRAMFGEEQLALGVEQENEPRLRKLLGFGDEEHGFSLEEIDVIIRAIDDIKVLDPACGSGAFPMGMLLKLVHVLGKLDPDNCRWKTLQTEKVMRIEDKNKQNRLLFILRENFEEERGFGRKLYLLENNIFGVDIQPIATQISKLRFFISLLVDQVVNVNEKNKGVKTLPNLEFRFVTANTLIGLSKPIQPSLASEEMIKDFELKSEELKEIRHQLFSARLPEEKKSLRTKDQLIRKEIKELRLRSGWDVQEASRIAEWDPFNQTEAADFFEPTWMMEKSAFNVIIGNPPYGLNFTKKQKDYFKNTYLSTKTIKGIQKGSDDSFSLFIEIGLNQLRINSNLTYIVPISFVSSDSMQSLHRLIETKCERIKISSYAVRPQPVFENAVVNTAIVSLQFTQTPVKEILCTRINRKSEKNKISTIIEDLEFTNTLGFQLPGRYPKIGSSTEKRILEKLFKLETNIGGITTDRYGLPLYYRSTGGRYFKVITNYSTGSSKEKILFVDKKYRDLCCAIMSSSLFFWYYQIYSNNLDLKLSEVLSC